MNPPLPSPPPIEDILPPFADPMSPWIIAAAVAAGLLVIAGVWLLARRLLRRPPAPPPAPGAIFQRELDALAARIGELAPYEIAVAACDALRRYLAAIEPGLPRSRTSEEFLRAAAETPRFGMRERELLADFLGTSDQIKFARASAPPGTAERLLMEARSLLRDPLAPV